MHALITRAGMQPISKSKLNQGLVGFNGGA